MVLQAILTVEASGITYLSVLLEGFMFSVAYPTISERQAYAVRAHRLRGAAVAGLIRNFARWVSAAAR